jgi:A/G-specific adenine glycosylase
MVFLVQQIMLRISESTATLEAFQREIYAYYRHHARTFPWRETYDPYEILVSEVMLQQTQAQRVLLKYGPFLQAFSTFEALAAAPQKDVLALWQGLGYNRRALALKATAEVVVHAYAGNLPNNMEELLSLPGIGRSTAGAVMAFAFQIPIAFIETNIRRVFIHFFFPGQEQISDADILPLVDATLNRADPRTWYYALMDYGVMLKENFVNPNRKSAHYKRQAPFEGSRRQMRGRILKALITHAAANIDELAALVHVDPRALTLIIQALESEGFVKRTGEGYILA